MNRFHLIIFALMMTVAAHAQFINNGATVTIQSGATLRVETSFENQAGTITIDNGGILEVQGNFTNDAGAGTTISPSGKVRFIGTGNSDVTLNGDAIHHVEMAKTTSTGKVTLLGNASINGNLEFTGTGNNKIELGNFDLSLAPTSTVSATTDHMTNGYVVTGGTGRLRKSNLGTTPFTYPVGFDATTYNPVTISENGTPDTIGVRVLQKAFVNGASGSEITANVVDATWSITDAVAGGNDLSITPSWIVTDEVSFDRSQCRVVRYNGSKYDLDLATKGAATTPSPYSRQRTGITSTGNFIVSSSSFVKVAPKVFLEGAYVGGGLMRDDLRANNKLPTSQPYGTLTFTGTYAASHSGTESVDPAVFSVVGNNAIVDWVLLELRDKNTRSIVHARRSALLQKDGDVVDIDGTSPVRFDNINADDYHLSVRHRVHLGTRTQTSVSLGELSSPTINFTDNSNSIANSRKELGLVGSGIYGILTGDMDRNGFIVANDITAIRNF
ncbi:MAG: hypothetical protein IPO37_21800 [Saprospiraceae bacterium]|nr:hypothetical protein [Saprospiraceae bacterium]